MPKTIQGQTASNMIKLCPIKLKIKFPVEAGGVEDGEFNGWFYPVGEEKKTKKGDKWGSKGQGGKDQELELEVLPPDSTNRLIDVHTGIVPFRDKVDASKTKLNTTPGSKTVVEVTVTVYFVCCTPVIPQDGTIQDTDDCCKKENFTTSGGGENVEGLGMWRTGFDPDNKDCRTPRYSSGFKLGPPGDPLKNLEDKIHSLVRSDIMGNISRSYINDGCFKKEEAKKNQSKI